jgi:hypothetical protein
MKWTFLGKATEEQMSLIPVKNQSYIMELNKDLIDRIPYDPDREIPLIQSLELVQLRGNLALYLKASEYKDQIRAKFSYGNMMYDFSVSDIRECLMTRNVQDFTEILESLSASQNRLIKMAISISIS